MAQTSGMFLPHVELLRLSKSGLVLSSTDERHVLKFCEITKLFLKHRFLHFVRENANEPIAISYGNDSTPLQTRERWRKQWCDLAVVREGAQSKDYLIQRAWAQTLPGLAVVLFCEPKTMNDKTAASHFGAARLLAPFGVEMGARNLNIHHTTLDRAIFTSEDRLFRQQHELCLKDLRSTMDESSWKLLCLLSWYVSNGCCDHDVHNALKWSVHSNITDKSFMKEIWKSFASLRSGFSLLVQHAGSWISSFIVWREWAFVQQEALWAMLNLPPTLREELIELQLRWEDGSLCVHPRHQSQVGIIKRIEVILLKLWGFKDWTDSRWLTMGPQCKCLIAARLTGIDSLVRYTCGLPHVSDFHLGNYQPDAASNYFVARVAISSFVCDSAMAILLEDDRVPRQWQSLQTEINDELDYLHSIPMDIWSLVSNGCSVTGFQLQTACLQGGYIQASFVLWRLRAATRLPWSLVIGDRRHNLEKLAAGPPPEDLTSWKIYKLMQLGFPIESLLDGLELLSRLSWSSKCVEEGHASASALMKLHHRYGESQMKARAMVCQARLLFSRTHLQKRAAALEERLGRLRRKDPSKITGKAMYVKEIMQLLEQKKRDGRQVAKDTTNKLISKHGVRWTAMSATRQAEYFQKALTERQNRFQEINADIESVESELHRVRQHLDCEKTADEALKLSRCSLTISELQQFDTMWDDPEFSQSNVKAKRDAENMPATPALDWELERLSEMFIGSVPEACDGSPTWAKAIAPRRDAFSQSVLRLTSEDVDERYLLVLFCMQNPVLIGFVSLAAEEQVLRHPDEDDLMTDAIPSWAHNLAVERNFSWSDMEEYKPDCQIDVLMDTAWRGNNIVSDSDWMPLEAVLRLLPGPVTNNSSGSAGPKQPRGSLRSELLQEHPWLADIWKNGGQRNREETSPGTTARDFPCTATQHNDEAEDASDDSFSEETGVMAPEDVLDTIDARTSTMHTSAHGAAGPFTWRMMSGSASSLYPGESNDTCFRGDVHASYARLFASTYSLQASCSFSSNLYTAELAKMCAECWTAKMTHFYDIWVASDHTQHEFSNAEVQSFQEPHAFTDAFGTAQGRLLLRMQWLRDLKPERNSKNT